MENFSESFAPRTVFYVEDNAVNVLLMKAIFEQRPHLHLVVAETGRDALLMASGLLPDLLLLDMHLPDCDGRNLLPLLRKVPGCGHVPAIAVTAEYGFNLAGSGFAELWPKPLDLQGVLQRLDVLLPCRKQPAPAEADVFTRALHTAARPSSRHAMRGAAGV